MIGLLKERYLQIRKDLRRKLRPQLARLNARPINERRIAVAGIAAFMYVIVELLVLTPNKARRDQIEGEIRSVEQKIQTLKVDQQNILANKDFDPNKDTKVERDELVARIGKIDEQLGKLSVGLVSPTQMAKLLEDVLSSETDLILDKLETQSVESVVPTITTKDGQESGGMWFRHGVVLELRGSYFSTLHYLELLEALPWDFYWDELRYEVTEYPQGKIMLRIHTLSSDSGWIGV